MKRRGDKMEKQEKIRRVRRLFGIIGIAIGGILIAMVMGLVVGVVVKVLWNWLMPAIFGLTTITFWQAWGLVVLAHILFKSFPYSSPHHSHHDRWEKHFKKKYFSDCGRREPQGENAEG